ncbi:MAG: alanine dehydrogenase [Gammaproteobacteria bacterium]
MIIAVPKEIKAQEFRVGLTPESVKTLINDGHEVWIETTAGEGIGCPDDDYRSVGARIAANATETFAKGELIIKVKEPLAAERAMLQADQILFTYLHLASDPEQADELIQSGATCIAYETVTDNAGKLPLLMPMSAIAGRLAVQEAAIHLEKTHGGMGVLLSGAPGVQAESVVIIGGGIVGSNACRIALGLGARVTILDRSENLLGELDSRFAGKVNCALSTTDSIAEYVSTAAMVVGAVLVPGGKADHLIPASLVKQMRPGSVIADVAIDQGGCCENSRPTTHSDPTFIVDDVIHYCVANIPGAVPRTASKSLNSATVPFIRELANKGVKAALQENANFRNGLNVCQGNVTQNEVADDLGLPYVNASEALAAL